MNHRFLSSVFAFFAATAICYGSTIDSIHTHLSFRDNCPVCHFQLIDSTDIQDPVTFNISFKIQYLQEFIPYFNYPTITYLITWRAPPVKS
ncbi:MAG: hypothetical protein WBK20_00695 [Spirochaetota bacterium]